MASLTATPAEIEARAHAASAKMAEFTATMEPHALEMRQMLSTEASLRAEKLEPSRGRKLRQLVSHHFAKLPQSAGA